MGDPPGTVATLAGALTESLGGKDRNREHRARVPIDAVVVARYAAAVGETRPRYLAGELAPPMFVAVYAAAAVWPVVLAVAEGRGPLLHFAQEFEWGAPVRSGDRISTRAWAACSERRAVGDFHIVASCSLNQRGEEVSRGNWTILIPGTVA